MCEFQSLYFGNDGYVVWCKKCSRYQVAFASVMLNLTVEDFKKLAMVMNEKNAEPDYYNHVPSKSVVIPAPSSGVYILLTKKETKRLFEILEDADTEEKALEMISLFHQ